MVARGKFFLYDSFTPALTAGLYRMKMKLGLDTSGDSVPENDLPVEELVSHVRVTSPRFKLPPDQVLSTFPPANTEGSYEARLPQIVIKRRTLPWDRRPFEKGTESINGQVVNDRTPWLALVVIAEGEGEVVHDLPWQDCVTEGVSLDGQADVPKASCLKVPESVVKAIFPTIDDLPLLTHVREVNIEDTEAMQGDDDGFLAVVIANRIPQFDRENCAPRAYTACLVNLEGQLGALPKPTPPSPTFDIGAIALDPAKLGAAGRVSTGLTIPTVPGDDEPRFEIGDRDAVLHAVRNGAIVFHEGSLINRTNPGANGEGVTLGTISAEDYLEGNFANLSLTAEAVSMSARMVGSFGGFRFPLEKLVPERVLRFPVLASWRFTSAGAGSFEQLMENLDIGLLGTKAESGYRRAFPECADLPEGEGPGAPPARLPLQIADTGHVRMPHLRRTGDEANAWYRGPFSPHQLLRDPLAREGESQVLAHVSDHLRMMTPDGQEDVSLAIAFEIGRLLAMSQPSFVAALMRWRDHSFGAERARASQRFELADRMGLLDGILAADIRDNVGRAIAEGLIERHLEAGLVEVLDRRKVELVNPRPLVDPGMPAAVLDDDMLGLVSVGLNIDRATLDAAVATLDVTGGFERLQETGPKVDPLHEPALNDALRRRLDSELERGLFELATAAIGSGAIDLQTIRRLRDMGSLENFLNDRLERD